MMTHKYQATVIDIHHTIVEVAKGALCSGASVVMTI